MESSTTTQISALKFGVLRGFMWKLGRLDDSLLKASDLEYYKPVILLRYVKYR